MAPPVFVMLRLGVPCGCGKEKSTPKGGRGRAREQPVLHAGSWTDNLCPAGMSKFIWSLLLQRLSFVDVATGWFGQGLGAACGMAYTGKYFDKAR